MQCHLHLLCYACHFSGRFILDDLPSLVIFAAVFIYFLHDSFRDSREIYLGDRLLPCPLYPSIVVPVRLLGKV